MASVLKKTLTVSAEAYLQGEQDSNRKHEYVNGTLFAMAGAKRSHDTLCINLIAYLHTHLRGTPCRVHSGDMKVRVQTAHDDCFFYPDVHITCAATDTQELFNSQPKVIIEVLSDSTERYDRADKFHYYRQLASLENYVLVAQDTLRVECYCRDLGWDFVLYQGEDTLLLPALDGAITLTDLYEGVGFPA